MTNLYLSTIWFVCKKKTGQERVGQTHTSSIENETKKFFSNPFVAKIQLNHCTIVRHIKSETTRVFIEMSYFIPFRVFY